MFPCFWPRCFRFPFPVSAHNWNCVSETPQETVGKQKQGAEPKHPLDMRLRDVLSDLAVFLRRRSPRDLAVFLRRRRLIGPATPPDLSQHSPAQPKPLPQMDEAASVASQGAASQGAASRGAASAGATSAAAASDVTLTPHLQPPATTGIVGQEDSDDSDWDSIDDGDGNRTRASGGGAKGPPSMGLG